MKSPELLLLLCFPILGYTLWEEFAGPFYIVIQQVNKCKNTGTNTFSFPTRVQRYNRTLQTLRGNSTFYYDIGENLLVHWLVSTKGTNGQYNNLIDFENNACEMLNDFFPALRDNVYTAAGLPLGRRCPIIKKGSYYFNDIVLILQPSDKMSVLPYGDYKAEFWFYTMESFNKTLVGCVSGLGQVRPSNERVKLIG